MKVGEVKNNCSLQNSFILFIYLFICLFIYLFIYLFICLFIYLFIYLFIHLYFPSFPRKLDMCEIKTI